MKRNIFIALVAMVVVGVVVGGLVYGYRTYIFKSTLSGSDSPSGALVLEKLGKHMVLPSGTPTVGTISDITLLRQKSDFFSTAKNGDSVIIYTDKAIIFDMKADKIVNIGPVMKNDAAPRVEVTQGAGDKTATGSEQ